MSKLKYDMKTEKVRLAKMFQYEAEAEEWLFIDQRH